ncbi:MAG: hypothetical protein R3182_06160, partial [Draconibacterium sp.]|nr:hypothetical protein [Draconibacterium sp.]
KGLRFIFADWQLPQEVFNSGLVAIDKHYFSLSKKYGYEVTTPENVINMLGYTHLRNGDTEQAIEVFKENVNRYTFSSNVYDSLAEAYENNKQLDQAKTNYKKAYDLGKEQNHPNTSVYLKNFNRVKKALK